MTDRISGVHSPAHAVASVEINRETIARQQREISALRFLLKADLNLQRAIYRFLWDDADELVITDACGQDRLVSSLDGAEFADLVLRILHGGELPRYRCPITYYPVGIGCGGNFACADSIADTRDPKTKFETRAPQYLLSALKVWRAAQAKAEAEGVERG